ncbi:MAG TPA: SGNH/GDSL hydrolase family protein [Planctomycetota bacterium]|jgi:lysophospholipase L1-like esterase|nr:SGNH/GDSL hydrolase family protein [Planctomycetota bacterium]
MSHRPFAVFLLLLTTAVLTAGEALPTTCFANLRAGKAQTVVLYGTSLTAGGEWAVATKAWFAEQFADKVTVINGAGPGQNSQWGLANLNERVLAHEPDLVLMEFSYNDAHEKFKLTVEQAAKNLDAMVRGIHSKRPSCDIVLQVMNANWDGNSDKRPMSSRPQLTAFNDNYRSYAKTNNLPLIDHFPAWQALKEKDPDRFHTWVPDGTHPTKEGSLAVTWPAVKALFERAVQASAKR